MEYGIKQYIFVIRELTAREIKRKYSRSVLGILWSVLNPLLFMIVMSFVFSGYASSKSLYPVYFLTGYTAWTLFNTATTTAMSAFEDNKGLLTKTKLPRELFVLSRDYTAFVNLGFSLIALLFVLIAFRVQITWTIIFLPITVFAELLFTIGVSIILATIYVFHKDIKFIWQNLMVVLVHTMAIYVPIDRYPEYLKAFTRNNPMFMYADLCRKCVIDGTYDYHEILIMGIWAVATFIVGIVFLKLKEDEIIKKI